MCSIAMWIVKPMYSGKDDAMNAIRVPRTTLANGGTKKNLSTLCMYVWEREKNITTIVCEHTLSTWEFFLRSLIS